ncbi:uncharacterized protein LOC128193390 [Vigna angularis]|uniref:uncharacterized protein LOC128193390 n=1 Tax=Phaseolus angularis TaxID=3914 RepID=UPI0022B352F8|nr:uncharacterized protein LOC128193390 [Vigna angularis]
MQCISFSLMFSVHRLCYLLLFFSLRVLGLARFRIDDSFLGENGCLMVQALVDSEGRTLASTGLGGQLSGDIGSLSELEILIGHIPVIDEKGMIGMVSIGDVVHVVVREHRQEFEHLNAFIQGGY